MDVKEPNTRKAVLRIDPELETGSGTTILRNALDQPILRRRVREVLQHQFWHRFEKANTRYRVKMLEQGIVPSIFAKVLAFKGSKRTKRNKRGLPLRSIANLPVRPMQGSKEISKSCGQRVVHGDCIHVMKDMKKDSVDVTVTSPPYNIGIAYNSYDDRKTQEEYLSWIKEMSSEVCRVLKPNGSFFLNVGGTNKDPNIPDRVCAAILGTGDFVLQNEITWVKSISIKHPPMIEEFKKTLKDLGLSIKDLKKIKPNLDLSQLEEEQWRTHGHFKPINSKRFVNNCYEKIYHFTKKGDVAIERLAIGVPYEHKSNIARWKHNSDGESLRDKRCKGNCWHIPYKTVVAAKDHPAGYPPQLAEECIKLHGVSDSLVVLDPFLGAGSTLVACRNLGVHGLGLR